MDTDTAANSDAYDFSEGRANLSAALEVFKSTVENGDYVMGEMQQKAAESGLLKEIIFGRNEPALHHFHNNYREALGEPLLSEHSAGWVDNFSCLALHGHEICAFCAWLDCASS